jgi:CRISPR-associated endonuclease/helicase Cas3
VLLAHSASPNGAPAQCYADHITAVHRGACQRAEAMLRYASDPPAGLLDAIGAAACFHDLGKLDPANQDTLRSGREARMHWDHIDGGVAHLSAKRNMMAAWLVRAHHAPGLPANAAHFTDPNDPRLRGRRNDDDEPRRHADQIARTDAFLAAYLAAHDSALGRTEIARMPSRHGLTMRLALSCLVDADHTDSARAETMREPVPGLEPRWKERLARLDDHVAKLPRRSHGARDLNRQAFYEACRDACIGASMVACEGPVGIGKTTAVPAYLLRRASMEGLRHLIVVAPYTNIISQTVGELRRALTLPGEQPQDVVVEHHHRADFESLDARDMAVLWRAPVIVTTAVQLFETLASNHPGQLRKLHELPGSAIFIDEAHAALPTPLWPQNWRWLQELTTDWRCCIVFASGSLARFWENPDIVDDPVKLPELLPLALAGPVLDAEKQRVRYTHGKRCETSADLVRRVSAAPGPRLVILNTVQSAAVVARAMREDGHQAEHLSTALCPRHRDMILARVKERLVPGADGDWTLVATSCVEAGVDLSFRTAFRERFSTASLIQVGGRTNRHAEFPDGGEVVDFMIDSGAGITAHPAARRPGSILGRQLRDGRFEFQKETPAELVTAAMREEIRDLADDRLGKAERERDYPEVAKAGRVIDTDTRLVVVESTLLQRLEARERVKFQDLLLGSVQIWATAIEHLGLEPVRGHGELYAWQYDYDAKFLGYMAGVLKLKDFQARGGAIL